jgi:hypothetical protein
VSTALLSNPLQRRDQVVQLVHHRLNFRLGGWIFDDPAVGLSREPFVSGIDTMIDGLAAQIPNAEKGFRLLFSATPFPGYAVKLAWRREEYGGNCYYSPELDMEGWLCPALLRYFDKAPPEMYGRAEART